VSELDITVAALPATPGAAVTLEPAGAPAAAESGASLNQAALPILLESLLFVAAEPTPVARLAQILDVSQAAVETGLADLSVIYRTGQRGIRLQRKGERVQLTTAPEAAPYIERFLGLDLSARLSPAALEALSVIAYKQPLTRADLEAVRGVNCDGVLRTLLARELVEPVGRLEQPGRPFQYGTTGRFLQYLGLESLTDLPPLPESSV